MLVGKQAVGFAYDLFPFRIPETTGGILLSTAVLRLSDKTRLFWRKKDEQDNPKNRCGNCINHRLSVKADGKADKWLKTLMTVHSVFFLSCFFMPMTGMFVNMSNGEAGKGGTVALLVWCVNFFPIGVLAYRHFKK